VAQPTLDEIRATITDDQRAIINAVWEYHAELNGRWEWIPLAALYRKFANPSTSRGAGKDFVLSALSSISGSIIYEHQEHYYALTFLGVLLTDQGQDGIDLLARYFELVQKKHDEGLDLKEIKIDSQEVATTLDLSKEKLRFLYELIEFSWLGNVGGGKEQWTLSVTPWRDEFLTEDNLRAYIEQQALRDYDQALPVELSARTQYLYEKENKALPSEFSFIRNKDLRELLEADWKESQIVHNAKAWKSCVILCGSILEGMLFDILSRDEPKSLAAYARLRASNPKIGKPTSSISDLNLNALVEIASELKMLPPGPFHLSHALRHSRNLVHPEKQLREKVDDIENEANISLSSMKVFLRIASTI
jgi:hypothetical protein